MHSDHTTDSDTKSTCYIFTLVVPWSCRHHYSGHSSFRYKYESMMEKKPLPTQLLNLCCKHLPWWPIVYHVESLELWQWSRANGQDDTRVCTHGTHSHTHNTQRKKTSKCWRWTQQRLSVLQTAFSCRSQNKNRMRQIISPMSEKDSLFDAGGLFWRKKYLKSPELLRTERL